MRFRNLFVLCALCLGGCLGGAPKDIQSLAAKERGLVAMQVDFKGMVRPTLKFRRYDPETGEVLKGVVAVKAPEGSVKDGPHGKMPSGNYLLEVEFEPGHWFLHEIVSYSLRGFNARTMSYDSYAEGSFGFEVQPGTVRYVGNFELARVLSVAEWHDFPADHVSRKFRYNAADLEIQPAWYVTFDCPREMSIVGRPGCDLGRVSRHENEPVVLAALSWRQNGWVRPIVNEMGPTPVR